MLHWISLRRGVFYKYLIALFLASAFGLFLSFLYTPSTFRACLSRIGLDSGLSLKVTLAPDAYIDLGTEVPDDALLSKPISQPTTVGDTEAGTANDDGHVTEGVPLGMHTFTSDGLLIVNPDGPHPIFQLIHDAEAVWGAKLARASRTLDQAVTEYKRRYRRAPPLGFDKWWTYVVNHRVQLPDEYDEIYEDLEHFWGIDPAELVRTQYELENEQGVVTVQKTKVNPHLEIVNSTLPPKMQHLRDTVEHILKLMHEIEEDLPPLRITISPFDNPDMFSSWQLRNMTRDAAAKGTTLKQADLPAVEKRGWIEGCAPDSPARLNPPVLPSPGSAPLVPPESTPRTFIASHKEAMNPCTNPSLLATHGQFLSYEIGPYPKSTLVPRFSLCATLLHDDIRPPVPYGWSFESETEGELGAFEGDLAWPQKSDRRLNWRGRTTGIMAKDKMPWKYSQRARLVTLGNALSGNVSVLRTPKPKDVKGSVEDAPVGEPEQVALAEVNEWLDVAFAGEPITCDQEGGICDEMKAMWEFQLLQDAQAEGQYKFVLDVDGNGWSGRFKRLLTSNALVFKSTIYPEWYTSRIVPWVHYVPIQVSYVDLYDAIAFFRVHDELAKRIAMAGRDWSRRFWRREDMTAYLYRLLLEYARVSSLDRPSMDYVG